MRTVQITCKGTVKHPTEKDARGNPKVIEKFEFDFTGTVVEAISDVSKERALAMVKMQHKIDQLNVARTAYVNKRLAELGLAKVKEEVDPRIAAIKSLLAKLPKDQQEAKFQEIIESLNE